MSEVYPRESARQNGILSTLPSEEYARLVKHFEYVELLAGDIIYRPEEEITHVYFPLRGTISLVVVLAEGSEAEVGVIGREGLLGLPVAFGTDFAPLAALVQTRGGCVKMRSGPFSDEVSRCGDLLQALLRYAQAFFVQTAQTAACNRLHPLDGRLARWLLTCSDRAQSDSLRLTQEFMSTMLGVRRAGVTEAAGRLQAEGLIEYGRGHLRISDKDGLEGASCECYRVVRNEYERLLGGKWNARMLCAADSRL